MKRREVNTMWKIAILFFILYAKVECFQPNCIPDNQFKFFGFPVEACSENFDKLCKFHAQGFYKTLRKATVVKIKETPTLPTCAFVNSPELKHIYGVNSKIKVLAAGSFINLPNLETIQMAFNSIREIRKDVFNNVSVNMLDLSWNKITFIDHHAFDQVANIKHLNLSKNSLATVPLNTLPKSLVVLNLSYNFLNRLLLKSERLPNLNEVDFSNNVIEKVVLSYFSPLEKIDLTSNRLQGLDYIDLLSVKYFRMGKNLFETVPNYLVNLNAQEVDVYPNPWRCEEIFLLWEQLVTYNIRITPTKSDSNRSAICSNDESRRLTTARRSNDCVDDYECPDNLACRTGTCWDPCEESLCPNGSICNAKNHEYTCSCPTGYHQDPLDIYSACNKVDCYTTYDCKQGKTCLGQQCVSLVLPSTPLTYNQPAYAYITPPMPPKKEIELPWWYDEIPNFEPPQRNPPQIKTPVLK